MGAESASAEKPLKERINLLKVPLDIVRPDNLEDAVYEILSDGNSEKGKNIVLLSLWDLLRARRNNEYRGYVLNASLVIPISKSLVSGSRFLTRKTPCRYMPFNFAVTLLTILEKKELTVYLLGGRSRILQKTENNIRQTFPGLRIVGRHVSPFRRQEEAGIIEAIRKAAPHLLLVGKGARGGEVWIGRNNARLGQGLKFWCSDLFDVFAKKKRRPSEAVFERGLEGIVYCFRNPAKFFRLFPYLHYKLLLLVYKLRRS
ncbi:MAG: WecB/TagA/CpsF family glycosyltransferase [Treponema sp.]|jgi:N-acetylglucosaminyldiphosphoundecaprenol N-acetyl-beta-D-mannosaminyltransferase|nr:WecB/TagA/CpsF family glycosyltransferase [Treponema sp.]